MTDTPLDPTTFLREHVLPRARRRLDDLRAQVQRLEADIQDRLAAEAIVELVLEGDGGGRWFLHLAGGEMQLAERAPSPPLLRVYQSRPDWEALARAQVAGGPRGTSMGADLTRTRVERLRGLQGVLEFRLTTDEGERTVQVQFGPGERTAPRCALRMHADDARRLQAGELAPQAAFLQGLVKLEGDVAFAMQVGAALLL
jgi:putative sterol carrier protein